MAARNAFRLLFILYCIEAGAFLILAPWSPAWDRHVIQLPFTELRMLFLHPGLRGAVSGFGFVHLIWGAHDIELWLERRRRQRR